MRRAGHQVGEPLHRRDQAAAAVNSTTGLDSDLVNRGLPSPPADERLQATISFNDALEKGPIAVHFL